MVPHYCWPDPADRAADLRPVALAMVRGIRDLDPAELCKAHLGRLDGWEMWGLVCLLAAAVDPRADPAVLWGWAEHADLLRRPEAEPVGVG